MESCSFVLVKIPATVTRIVWAFSGTSPSNMVSPTVKPFR